MLVGEKHHCKLRCGRRAGYRRKSAYEPATSLTSSGQVPRPPMLYATDAILDYQYLTEFFPSLRELSERHVVSSSSRSSRTCGRRRSP